MRFTTEVALVAPDPGLHLGRWSPTSTGELAVVWEGPPPRSIHLPPALQVGLHDPETGAATTVFELGEVHLSSAVAAPLPGERVVLAGTPVLPRSTTPGERARTSAELPTALVFDAAGAVVAEGHVGRHVADLFTTAAGALWVMVHIEGAVASDGRFLPPLVRYDRELRADFEFRGQGAAVIHGGETIALCGEHAWIVVEGDVYRVAPPHVEHMFSRHASVVALAVDGDLLGWAVWRPDAPPAFQLHSLEDPSEEAWIEGELVAPTGEPLPSRCPVVGRDDTLHAVVDGRWLQLCLAALSV